jgi:hypothetical protein
LIVIVVPGKAGIVCFVKVPSACLGEGRARIPTVDDDR